MEMRQKVTDNTEFDTVVPYGDIGNIFHTVYVANCYEIPLECS